MAFFSSVAIAAAVVGAMLLATAFLPRMRPRRLHEERRHHLGRHEQ
jgi:uncharacterized MnhB-related membrane protein